MFNNEIPWHKKFKFLFSPAYPQSIKVGAKQIERRTRPTQSILKFNMCHKRARMKMKSIKLKAQKTTSHIIAVLAKNVKAKIKRQNTSHNIRVEQIIILNLEVVYYPRRSPSSLTPLPKCNRWHVSWQMGNA